MILGGTCTRACKFCHVDTGNPNGYIDINEIENAAKMVDIMGLKYLVVTSVDRDDLPDYGAQHFANVVNAIRERLWGGGTNPATDAETIILNVYDPRILFAPHTYYDYPGNGDFNCYHTGDDAEWDSIGYNISGFEFCPIST